ncbi:hypothetical protein BN874_1860015 [Candidatus Contendobacter odensis Run_B_J11]|uniref:Uncharacterized protein n=1 Tax=Candidatus Contendobacter odensis Run_B_J11 TaxID=1400861 RepID=A0A7U7GAT7_9GAMM|nr:hypothetical protein BN874_1860015 [Candidatus Contendobacter odensis Run_B_J11]
MNINATLLVDPVMHYRIIHTLKVGLWMGVCYETS